MRISFDFDGTLDDYFDNHPNVRKNEIRDLAKRYILENHDVCILTRRYDTDNESNKVYRLAKELGIKNVYFTNRSMKFPFIINLGIEKHFDDCEYEIDLINRSCAEQSHVCLTVHVEDKNWIKLI